MSLGLGISRSMRAAVRLSVKRFAAEQAIGHQSQAVLFNQKGNAGLEYLDFLGRTVPW
jgi:hypothetical protein